MAGNRSILILLWAIGSVALAAVPDFNSILPVAASPGTSNQVVFYGKFEPWPPKVWSEPAGVTFVAETNKNRFVAIVDANASPGPRLVRVYNEEGVSEPQFFIVDPAEQLEEKEPNNKFTEPQGVTFPVVVNGRLNARDDVDNFGVELKKGEWLEAWLEAYTLMSKFDGVLRILTTNGVTLAWNHDYGTLDPRVWWQAVSNQTVIVQVFGFVYPANNEIRLYGSDEANYRMHISKNGPPGWTNTVKVTTTFPLEVTGTLTNIDQEDRFEFVAKKDEVVEARIEAAKIGSPLDAWLKITDAAGKQLAREDDTEGSRDPRIEWKAPAETNYFLTVGSTLNRSSTNHHYRLTARTLPQDFRAIWAASSVVLTNNSTNTIKLDLKRLRGHTNDLVAEFRDLPDGVTASPTELTNKSGEVTFTLSATNASAFQGPIRLELLDGIAKTKKAAVVELISRGENNGVPNGYSTLVIESYDHFWLTIRPESAVKQVASTNEPVKE